MKGATLAWSGRINSDMSGMLTARSYNGSMSINELVPTIDSEIAILRQVRALLVGDGRKAATKVKKHHTMSAEARERIAAAQRKRWALQRKAARKAA